MKLKKIEINNFKSIEKAEINIEKVNNSFTKIFVGQNESGKSNLLEAMCLINNFEDYIFAKTRNRNLSPSEISVKYFFEGCVYLRDPIFSDIFFFDHGDVDLRISNICISLSMNSDNENKFNIEGKFDILGLSDSSIMVKNLGDDRFKIVVPKSIDRMKELIYKEGYSRHTEESFFSMFEDHIKLVIYSKKPKVIFWNKDDKYNFKKVDLNEFKENVEINKPLKNIFKIAGYNSIESIIGEVESALEYDDIRENLSINLSKKTTEYINNIWNNQISVVVRIEESGNCIFHIKDKRGSEEGSICSVESRSDGARHFLSIILSLSMENTSGLIKDSIILIDEPENHLHPSAIIDLKKELLNIGEDNYVFVSTHSPFMVDINNKTRNHIVKKENFNSCVKQCLEGDLFFSDKVLIEAFGLNVYKDLLPKHTLVVEGSTDKKLIKGKIDEDFLKQNDIKIGVGGGDKIVDYLLHYPSEIDTICVLDDDDKGREIKRKVIENGTDKAFTLKDLCSDLNDGSTIEDFYCIEFIKSKLTDYYDFFKDINLTKEQPIIKQIEYFILNNKKTLPDGLKTKEEKKYFFFNIKKSIADDAVDDNFKLDLVKKFIENLKNEIKKTTN